MAGAIWGPHLVGPDDRVDRWGLATLERLYELAETGPAGHRDPPPAAAVRSTGPDGSTEDPVGRPGRRAPVRAAATCPSGYASGWRYTAPVIVDAGLPRTTWRDRLGHARAARWRPGSRSRSPAEAAGRTAATVLVNCTGTGAHGFVRDPCVVPVRGQAVVAANPGLSEFFVGMAGTARRPRRTA